MYLCCARTDITRSSCDLSWDWGILCISMTSINKIAAKKICFHWIPHNLTQAQKDSRLNRFHERIKKSRCIKSYVQFLPRWGVLDPCVWARIKTFYCVVLLRRAKSDKSEKPTFSMPLEAHPTSKNHVFTKIGLKTYTNILIIVRNISRKPFSIIISLKKYKATLLHIF